MISSELLALFRTEVGDIERPYLWGDAVVYSYIDDAQKQFCRDTNGIADARSFVLSITTGNEWYAVDPKILKLRDAVLQSTGQDMPIISIEKMAENSMRFDTKTGPIQALISGMDEGYLRSWPVPSESATVELRTFRLPEEVVAGGELEIPEQHHMHLLNWVKYLAFSNADSGGYNKDAADSYEAKHKLYCVKARIEQNRARRPVSTVTYGGI